MTTAGSAAQASRTVNVQDMRLFSLGQRTGEFAVQVISTSATELLVLIRRLDTNAGWGQELRLDIFIVDSVA